MNSGINSTKNTICTAQLIFGEKTASTASIRFQRTAQRDCFLLGDVNVDKSADLLDGSPSISLLFSGEFQAEADINQDGVVDLSDIQPLIEVLDPG